MPNKSVFLGNETLVDVLYKLKRLDEQGLFVDGINLARRISKLQEYLICVLEEITGNRGQPPMLDKDKSALINNFLSAMKEFNDIEQENMKYDLDKRCYFDTLKRDDNHSSEALEDLHLEEKEESQVTDKYSSTPPDVSGRVEIAFPVMPSLSLKEALIRKGFSFKDNSAYGRIGEWLVDMAEEIVLERGEIKMGPRKGEFYPPDRWM